MRRKDCDNPARPDRPPSRDRRVAWSAAQARSLRLGAVAGLLSCAAPAWGQTGSVRIWPRAVVRDSVVRLGDVAELSGLDEPTAARLAGLPIGQSPPPGQRLLLTHRELIAKARGVGLNLAEVRVSGSIACEVSRPAIAATTRPPAEPKPTVHPIAPVHEPPDGGGRSLEQAVVAHLRTLLAEYGGEVQVNLDRSARSRSALSLTEPQFSFRVRLEDPLPLGLVSLQAEVLEAGGVVQTVPLVAEVALVRNVAVARRPINRGMPIADRDVALSERRFTSLDKLGVTDLASIVGQQARRFVDRSEVLTARDLTPVPLVKRGQLVTVYHRTGGMMIRTVGKALEGGTYGSVIAVKNESSNRSFQARVSGPQTVEVLARRRGPAGPEAES